MKIKVHKLNISAFVKLISSRGSIREEIKHTLEIYTAACSQLASGKTLIELLFPQS